MQGKDINSIASWTVLGAVVANVTFKTVALLPLIAGKKAIGYISNQNIEITNDDLFIVGTFSTLMGATVGALIGSSNVASMIERYEERILNKNKAIIISSVGGMLGVMNACSNALITSKLLNKDINKLEPIVLGAVGASTSYMLAKVCGLNLPPISKDTIKKEISRGFIKKVLKEIKQNDNDVFKVLERYNKIYKKYFIEMGTPVEIAKMADKKEVAKEIINKNNELILSGLYSVRSYKHIPKRSILT